MRGRYEFRSGPGPGFERFFTLSFLAWARKINTFCNPGRQRGPRQLDLESVDFVRACVQPWLALWPLSRAFKSLDRLLVEPARVRVTTLAFEGFFASPSRCGFFWHRHPFECCHLSFPAPPPQCSTVLILGSAVPLYAFVICFHAGKLAARVVSVHSSELCATSQERCSPRSRLYKLPVTTVGKVSWLIRESYAGHKSTCITQERQTV